MTPRMFISAIMFGLLALALLTECEMHRKHVAANAAIDKEYRRR